MKKRIVCVCFLIFVDNRTPHLSRKALARNNVKTTNQFFHLPPVVARRANSFGFISPCIEIQMAIKGKK